MTSDTQINEVLKNVKNFKGVYLYDELNDIDQLRDEAIVINYVTQEESEKGIVGHFVVLDNRNIKKGNSSTDIYFFDPYGLYPDKPRNILGLPNTKNIIKLIERTGGSWSYNTYDFQAWMKGDNLCGVYSTEYVINPDFSKNKIFNENISRRDIDKKLIKLFGSLQFVNHPSAKYSPSELNSLRQKLSSI